MLGSFPQINQLYFPQLSLDDKVTLSKRNIWIDVLLTINLKTAPSPQDVGDTVMPFWLQSAFKDRDVNKITLGGQGG